MSFKAKSKRAAMITVTVLAAMIAASLTAYFTADRMVAGEAEVIELPIIMYHSVCINKKVDSQYFITPEKFESDLAYFAENGYTSVFVSEIADHVESISELPKKPIAITVDDGYYNCLCNILPLLKKYNMKATVNVVGDYTEEYTSLGDTSPAYAYLSWEHIKELENSGFVEIGNHTYSMHSLSFRKGCSRMDGEPLEHYENALRDDVVKLQDALRDNCGIVPTVFAYPYGAVSRESVSVLKSIGFRTALTCDEHINKIVKNPDILFSLGRINRDSRYSTVAFMSKYGL